MEAFQYPLKFNPKQVSFGRHETFPIRYGWLSKGFQALMENPKIFNDDNATVTLGVGKNMVSAIHYWLQAAQLIQQQQDKQWQATPIGKKLFAKADNAWDPYLEDEASLWLIHWLIASNPVKATSIFWFFNRFHKHQFDEAELLNALKIFVQSQIKGKRAASTLKIDVSVILRMYAPSMNERGGLSEEALDSPLANLKLLYRDGKKFFTTPEARNIPYSILGFAIAELFQAQPHISGINLRDLIHSEGIWPAPAAVFRISEAHLLNLLEELTANYPMLYELRDSAGIHQLYRKCQLNELLPEQFLQHHYASLENAA
ncbi:DUF4007 family protein [Candidatus Venteria ishoeyi]|uniref:DUF4007 family protein n=1 Tax=Candidatus Venteria ishoeyi TaxID=1899563 RepID=UPI0015AE79BD|nr:DUF4007 family protein [Candidatus Venteria ishoeyi]